MALRRGAVSRKTKETDITVELNLDGTGKSQIGTGIGFFDHLLTAFARHGLFDLEVRAVGDLEVDGHHTVEDVGICLGRALDEALGDRAGIVRYGWACLPMDEALVLVSVDLGGRPFTDCRLDLPPVMVGDFYTGLFPEFCRSLSQTGRFNLHVRKLAGEDPHLVLEAAMKALVRALSAACRVDENVQGIPSTKGTLS